MGNKKLGLGDKILIGMVLGAITGIIVGPETIRIAVIGDIFLRLLRMIIVPLIFTNVVLAITSMGDLKRLGKIGIKMTSMFVATTFIAGAIGMTFGLVIKPGIGFVMEGLGEIIETTTPTISETILGFFPINIMQSFSEGNMLHIITFALISGISILLLHKEDSKRIINSLELFSRYIMKVLEFVMGFTPYGVFALMANTTGLYGSKVFGPLGKFVITMYLALAFHALVVYGGIYFFSTRKNPFKFWKTIAPVWTTAFATCSSAATLPVSMRVCKEDLKLQEDITGLTIPIGATMNMNGNGVWYGVVTAFVIQVMGFDMSLYQMAMAIFTGVLMTLGAPGIPNGIFVATTVFLSTLGLPLEFVGLLGGVFRIIDMGLTGVNVVGSVVIATVLDAGEKRRERIVKQ